MQTDDDVSEFWLSNWFFLMLPWLFSGLIGLSELFDLTDDIARVLPYGLGKFAHERAMLGVIALFVGSSLMWAYRNERDLGFQGRDLLKATIVRGGHVALIQIIIWSFTIV